MARIHGKKGDVLLDPTGGDVPVRLASCDSWKLDLAKDRVDVTCFQDPNKVSVLGLADYSGDLSGAWDSETTPEQLFAVIFGDVPAMLHLLPSTLEPTFLFKGLANLDGSLSVSAKGAVNSAECGSGGHVLCPPQVGRTWGAL